MDLSQIYDLWNRFENSTAGEMELEMQGVRFCLKKAGAGMQTGSAAPCFETPAIPLENAEAVKETEKDAKQNVIKAPLVGTFYQAPSPEDAPYAEVGKQIHKGDVIGIIEAMKLMNEVRSDRDGIVKEIKAADGDMVEYGQILIVLE